MSQTQHIVDFSALEISVASPDTIKAWSHGEVRKPETINYRTLKAEKDGLFDEKIFGPMKDYECHCGKYKRIRYKGIICDKCGVEVTQSRVRRERMGHITLAAPVAHIWFFKGAPSKLSLILDISPRNLSSIIYFSQYVVLDVNQEEKDAVMERVEQKLVENQEVLKTHTAEQMQVVKDEFDKAKQNLKSKVKSAEALELRISELNLKAKNQLASLKEQLEKSLEQLGEVHKTVKAMAKRIRKGAILSEDEYLKLDEYDAVSHVRVGMGAEAIYELIKEVDLADLVEKLRIEVRDGKGAKRVKATKRLRVAEGILKAKISPTWMFWTIVPVLPPDLRPMVQLSGGRFATSDLNDLYRRVLNRNNRLKHLIDLGAPEIILRNEKRMLQEAVDALIDSAQARQAKRRSTRKPLRSLSEMLRGKQGRFRQNLLGKRVDYSGRSVIVVGPELKLNQCGLPKDMALEMFKPYVLHHLIERGIAPNVKSAKHLIDRREPEVYDILEQVIDNHPVVLNRAPTLHKLGMQAFYPILVEGKAIRLHPCVCAGYNADFDGDQMAVHVPLTEEAQTEARELMVASHNLLKPANSEPITVPNKEMAMGVYYLTCVDTALDKVNSTFSSEGEAMFAWQAGKIALRQLIRVRVETTPGVNTILETTIGRLRFNAVLPVSLRFMNEPVNAKKVKEVITRAIELEAADRVSALIDDIKDLGFEIATISGLSVSVSDCLMITEKDTIIEEANKRAEEIQQSYLDGLITSDERRHITQQLWIDTTDTVAEQTWNSYPEINAVKVIINSGGTRASKDQVKQLAAMRGLVVDPLGKIVEMPTKSNFRQGLSIFEYVTSARGSRKGLTDSALKTADAGYLTRRLCDVAHNVIIRMEDCGTTEGVEMTRSPRESVFATRLVGRIVQQNVVIDKKTILKQGEMITADIAATIAASKLEKINVRSPLSCAAPRGLCAACYGWDFSTRRIVEIGVPVGVVAAQSIGEPGTQLTMRVKHSGGIVGLDVTQGLPRVEEMFEARMPKTYIPMAEISGKVSLVESGDDVTITIHSTSQPGEERSYTVSKSLSLTVKENELVYAGQPLALGNLDVREILRISGMLASQLYVIQEIQRVYESQGIPIHDKHFEVIVRKMSDKLQIEASGDTEFLIGEVVEKSKFVRANDAVMAAGGDPATAKVMILGITRSALFTSSWLSAASFQHTKNVLTDAAANGAIDYLEGLKENVIIGRLIPTSEERARVQV